MLARAALAAAVTALAGAAAHVPPPLPQWSAAQRLCTTRQPALVEDSGIAGSARRPGVLFALGDNSTTVLALDRRCRTLATIVLDGAPGRDVEDLAAAPDARGRASLWIADIGDNDAVRDAVAVDRVDEPELPGAGTDGATAPVLHVVPQAIRLRYPDGAHDAEALLVLPGGELGIVTKDAAGAARVYTARVPRRGATGVVTLRRVGSVLPPPSLGDSLLALSPAVTGGAVAPGARAVVLRTYGDAWAWPRAPGEPLAAVLRAPPERIRLPAQRQGEGIGFARGGRWLVVSSEGAGEPLWVLRQRKARPSPR